MHKECMHRSNYFRGKGNFSSKSTLQYPLIHTDIHNTVKKRVIFLKKKSVSSLKAPKVFFFSSYQPSLWQTFVYSICRGLKQFFKIIFIKSCIFCKV